MSVDKTLFHRSGWLETLKILDRSPYSDKFPVNGSEEANTPRHRLRRPDRTGSGRALEPHEGTQAAVDCGSRAVHGWSGGVGLVERTSAVGQLA